MQLIVEMVHWRLPAQQDLTNGPGQQTASDNIDRAGVIDLNADGVDLEKRI